MRKITAGDCVRCRKFNTPDGHFYGDTFDGQIIEYRQNFIKDTTEYDVKRADGTIITLKRKEIIKRIPYFEYIFSLDKSRKGSILFNIQGE